MTSQIAIFGPLGVAVSSDTVSTISSDRGTKSTNNAQKIWELGDPHLIVVAHSGSVQSNGIHGQLLISEWSRTLTTSLPTVSDYANNFVNWYSSRPALVPVESHLKEIHIQLNDHYYEIQCRTEADAVHAENEQEVADILHHHVNVGLDWLNSLENYPGITDQDDAELIKELEIDLDDKIKYFLGKFPGIEEVMDVLRKSAPLVLSRVQDTPSDSTFAFIGFGSDDYFATSVQVECRGLYGKAARVFVNEPFGASAHTRSGAISFFAQDAAMTGFLRGAQLDVMEVAYRKVWDRIGAHLEDEDELKDAREFMASLRSSVDKFQTDSFISPMLATIGTMSLTDIANLAASLVGMQAIRSAASPEPASVGGFIESLVISRAEGVRWINRLPQ